MAPKVSHKGTRFRFAELISQCVQPRWASSVRLCQLFQPSGRLFSTKMLTMGSFLTNFLEKYPDGLRFARDYWLRQRVSKSFLCCLRHKDELSHLCRKTLLMAGEPKLPDHLHSGAVAIVQ